MSLTKVNFYLTNKVCILTGGTQGLGKRLAFALVGEGVKVIICSRNLFELTSVSESIKTSFPQFSNNIIYFKADVSSIEECQALVDYSLDRFGKIDILINNAGIYGSFGLTEDILSSEWKRAFEINFYGSVNMYCTTIPIMKKQRFGNVIQMSGGGATKPMPYASAYAASKAAIVRFMETASLESSTSNININCVAPGALNTRLLDQVLSLGPQLVGQSFYDQSVLQKEKGGTKFDYSIELIKFLCSDKSNGLTGRLISAPWDNWIEFPQNIDQIRTSDVFTLRRIIGSDRGLSDLDNSHGKFETWYCWCWSNWL